MTIAIIGLLIILVVLGVFNINADDSSERLFLNWLTIVTSVILTACIIVLFDDGPKAIDVYRGYTFLEITYQDSIPVDSVVIFKKREP